MRKAWNTIMMTIGLIVFMAALAPQPIIAAGEVQTAVGVPPGMVYVAGGTFQMGNTLSKFLNQRSAHQVTLRSFYMQKTEVTYADYDRFCEANGQKKWSDIRWAEGEAQNWAQNNGLDLGSLPVLYTRWSEAIQYAKWLSAQEGLESPYITKNGLLLCDLTKNGYRLPTEAEWEFAARGGTLSGGFKYSGSNDLDTVAWYKDNAGGIPHPVATKQPNELGLYDMSGNVMEFCWDWLTPYLSSPVINPLGQSSYSRPRPRPNHGVFDGYVARGGYYGEGPYVLRTSFRSFTDELIRNNNRGFRLVRTAPSPSVTSSIPNVSGDYQLSQCGGQYVFQLKLDQTVNMLQGTLRRINGEEPIANIIGAIEDDGTIWFKRDKPSQIFSGTISANEMQGSFTAGDAPPPTFDWKTGKYTVGAPTPTFDWKAEKVKK